MSWCFPVKLPAANSRSKRLPPCVIFAKWEREQWTTRPGSALADPCFCLNPTKNTLAWRSVCIFWHRQALYLKIRVATLEANFMSPAFLSIKGILKQWCQHEQWPNMTQHDGAHIFIYFLQSSSIRWGRVYLFLCSEDSHRCGLRSSCSILVERQSVESH